MCVADEAWALDPPSWASPPNPASTRLFRTYRAQANHIIPPGGSTVQGIYCMTPDGDFLSGSFATSRHGTALAAIQEGLRRFKASAAKNGYAMKPVPTDRLDHVRGGHVPAGGLKLEVAIRDLPRGGVRHPGRAEWQQKAFNLNWLDLSAAEASALVTIAEAPTAVPAAVLQKIALNTLKDTVRGQSSPWQPTDLREAEMHTQCLSNVDGVVTVRLTGRAVLRGRNNAYSPTLDGRAVYDTKARRFREFRMVAIGQRQGRTQFNFRQDDTAPAPLGIALSMAE